MSLDLPVFCMTVPSMSPSPPSPATLSTSGRTVAGGRAVDGHAADSVESAEIALAVGAVGDVGVAARSSEDGVHTGARRNRSSLFNRGNGLASVNV